MIPFGEVDFGDFETQGLYKIAAEFPDSFTANMFLQIYRDSGVEVPEFLQVYLNAYVKDLQSRTDVTEDAPDSLPELPFDVKDVAPLGTLNFSDESLNTINELFEREGLPPPEGLESEHPDEGIAPSDESDIMESPDAQEEDESGDEDTDDPVHLITEGAGETAKIGDDFGKLGTMVENPGLKADWANTTAHGKERMAQRGVTQSMVDAWMEGGKVLVQNSGNYIYITKEGAAVFNSSGILITTYTSKDYDDSMWSVVKRLFGE